MGQHLLAPGMQGQDDAWGAPELLGTHFQKRIFGTAKEQAIHLQGIGQDQFIEVMRGGKHRMVERGGQIPRQDRIEPRFTFQPTAARAMTVVALRVQRTRFPATVARVSCRAILTRSTCQDLAERHSGMHRLIHIVLKRFAISMKRS